MESEIMKEKIFSIDEKNKKKKVNFNSSEDFDSKKISSVLTNNPFILMKHWIIFQQEWVYNTYNLFKDHDKYIILMYLISKTWQDNSNLFKFYSIDEYYSQNMVSLQDIALSEVARDLVIPKETIRRKLVELEKANIIKRKGQKIILAQLALSLQKPENSIKAISIFFEKLSILLSTQEWFGPPVNRADIELYFKKYYTVFWNHYFKLQIPFLIRWKIIFGDLESWVIWANMGINQSLNLEKINKKLNAGIESSQNDRKNNYLYNVLETEPKQGVNVSSIADVSGIPRATVFRKLKKLSNDKIIKRNKKLEYILTNEGILNEEIQVNFLINQKCIALFVTDIFNLIKKSSLKI